MYENALLALESLRITMRCRQIKFSSSSSTLKQIEDENEDEDEDEKDLHLAWSEAQPR